MKIFTDFISFLSKNASRGRVHIPFLINKKKSLLIVLIVLLFTSSSNAIDNSFNFKFEVNKINYQNGFIPSSPHGYFTVTFTPGEKGKYLSVLAENNSENISGFIVENLFLTPIAEADSVTEIADSITELSTVFLLSKVSSSFKLPIKLTLTAYITDFVDYFPFMIDSIAEVTTVDVKEMIYIALGVELEEMQVTESPVNEQQQPVGDDIMNRVVRRDMDNIDLDSSAHPPGPNFWAGDYNAAAPAAAANSLHWLSKRYQDAKLPADQTLRKSLEELSSGMIRENNKAPTEANIIGGKLTFIDIHLLKINIRFQCEGREGDIFGGTTIARDVKRKGAKPSYAFLSQMMFEGEDVEISYAWKDSTGKFVGSQMVVVTRLEEYFSGVRKIRYKHDTNQRCPGGTKEEDYKLNTTDTTGFMRFGPNNEYYITCIIAESPNEHNFNETLPVEQASSLNLKYELAQNYPNPFNPETNFGFRIADPDESGQVFEFVSLKIYDVLGNEISTLVNEEKPAGEYTIRFDASSLASGVYYYTLKAGSFVETKKMIVLK